MGKRLGGGCGAHLRILCWRCAGLSQPAVQAELWCVPVPMPVLRLLLGFFCLFLHGCPSVSVTSLGLRLQNKPLPVSTVQLPLG